MTTIQEKQGSVQERQNQKILDFAIANFPNNIYEYGNPTIAGKVANRQGERVDPSRDRQDLDRDGRKEGNRLFCTDLLCNEGSGF